MTITGQSLIPYLGLIRYPASIRHYACDAIAIDHADRDVVEQLATRDAIVAKLQRNRVVNLRLTKPLGSLQLSIRKRTLPIAECNRTVRRVPVRGGGGHYYEFNHRVMRGWGVQHEVE